VEFSGLSIGTSKGFMESRQSMGFCKHFNLGFLVVLAVQLPCSAGEPLDVFAPDGGGDESRLNPEAGSIPMAERAFAEGLIDDYIAAFGPLSEPVPGVDPPPFQFFPIGGRLWKDLLTINFVDLDPTAGVLDWDCTDYTEEGHAGNDTIIRGFAEQAIGVSVFAIADGVVVAANDGEPDQNMVANELASNFLIIDHGLGREVWYWHLKRSSVSVSPGDPVLAGQQIAEVGSSGNSQAPHLHLEIRIGGQVVEPFAGPCNPSVSLWANQEPIRRDTYFQDFGITTADLSLEASWPARWSTIGHVGFMDPPLRVWFLGANLPMGSSWKVRFQRPDGSFVAYDQPQYFGNTVPWRRFHWWWTYDVLEMRVIPGTWTILVYVNDELMVEAPIEVMPESDPTFNRPPETVAVHFDPLEPLAGDVVGCVIDASLTVDDPDYDIVMYEYVWVVNEDIVRRVTTAGHADYLSSAMFEEADLITCVVTPTDGKDNGLSTAIAIPAKRPAIPAASTWSVLGMFLLIATSATLILRRRTLAPGIS
jgi:Peptidase family M23